MTAATVLVVEDDNDLLEALTDTLSLAGYGVTSARDGLDAMRRLDEAQYDLVVSDIQMPKMDGHTFLKKVKANHPDLPVMLMTAYGSIQQAVDAMRDGAVDYMVKPFEAEVLVNMVSRYAGQPNHELDEVVMDDDNSKALFAMASKVANSDATVMITGESGVGKEVLARYIHRHSTRAEQPFVAINCAAIPENMLEATLFGYEKGAYTGAYKACPGKFEQAQGGTLLLDEITEMDLGLQAKLLRVLQEREVERLGGTKVIDLDVRVLATSNRNVRSYVDQGQFREDLFYRLNVFPLHILPLSQRRGDIILLSQRIVEKQCKLQNKSIPEFSPEALAKLKQYAWPGNVRELENVIQRALVLQDGDVIEADAIHFEVAQQTSVASEEIPPVVESTLPTNPESLNDDLKQREWTVILSVIDSVKGSRKKAAEKLGISQRTLRYKLAKMREAGVIVPDRSAELL